MSVKATKTVKNVVKTIGAATVVIVLGMAGCGDDGGNPGGGGNDIVYGTLTDARDGQSYRTVKIGTQTWMAENLNFDAENSRCYDDDPANCTEYGRLYDWNAVMAGSSSSSSDPGERRGICPVGWHVPNNAEWNILVNFVGSSSAGTKLKSATGWSSGNGTDDFGFSALPGGNGHGNSFLYAGDHGYWWSATEDGASNAWSRACFYDDSEVGRGISNKTSLFALRCLQE